MGYAWWSRRLGLVNGYRLPWHGLTGGEVGSDSENKIPGLVEHVSILRQSIEPSIDHRHWTNRICRQSKLCEKNKSGMSFICCPDLYGSGKSFGRYVSGCEVRPRLRADGTITHRHHRSTKRRFFRNYSSMTPHHAISPISKL